MSTPQLYLVTPVVAEPDGFLDALTAACAPGGVAALLLRMEPADERTLVKRLKALCPPAHERGAAVIAEIRGEGLDPVTIAARGGADGVHVSGGVGALKDLRGRLKDERILGCGALKSRDDCMNAGEAGVDYLLFGEPRPDGSLPALDAVAERAAWWAEIFSTPCVAFAPRIEDLAALAATGAEFVALGDAVWTHPQGPEAAVRLALDALASAEAPER